VVALPADVQRGDLGELARVVEQVAVGTELGLIEQLPESADP
jgi:hypothetical protein